MIWKAGQMRLVIFTEPQHGASYDDQRRVARVAEALGFDGFFRSDHFLPWVRPARPLDMHDLDHLELVASAVAPQLR